MCCPLADLCTHGRKKISSLFSREVVACWTGYHDIVLSCAVSGGGPCNLLTIGQRRPANCVQVLTYCLNNLFQET